MSISDYVRSTCPLNFFIALHFTPSPPLPSKEFMVPCNKGPLHSSLKALTQSCHSLIGREAGYQWPFCVKAIPELNSLHHESLDLLVHLPLKEHSLLGEELGLDFLSQIYQGCPLVSEGIHLLYLTARQVWVEYPDGRVCMCATLMEVSKKQ